MSIGGISSSSSYHPSSASRFERRDAAAGDTEKPQRAKEKENGELTPEEKQQVAKLKETDRAVRIHEMAHMAAGGGMITSGASYSYQKGPDGISYAVAGEVGIDTSSGRTPEETINRAQRIRAAALAPADPSGQDRAVAAQATQMEQQARVELAQQRREESSGNGGSSSKIGSFYSAQGTRSGLAINTYA